LADQCRKKTTASNVILRGGSRYCWWGQWHDRKLFPTNHSSDGRRHLL